MISSVVNYLILPKQLSNFEEDYLARMNRIAMWFFVLHLPVFVAIAYFNDTGATMALALTSLVLAGPAFAWKTWSNKRAVSTVMGVTAMFMGGLLVHFGQGPVQIEMHFYFFVLIALLAMFANPVVIIAAAVTAALHHAVLWLALPSSIFNYDAPFWVVAVHAAFVVLESVAASFIARSFFDNVIGLEKIVAERTAEVEKQSRDMRMILDSVKQGFFTIDREGRLSEERSAAVETLFGNVDACETLVDMLRLHDQKAADWLELGLEDVFDGFLPVEVTLDQLPSRLVAQSRHLSIQYSPIETEGELTGLAIVVSDITAEVHREQLEAESREMMAMIEGIAADRIGFVEFMDEAHAIVEALRTETRDNLVLLKRRVHTLKGNSSIYGLQRVADACHKIEDYIEEHNEVPEGLLWTMLFGCWASTRGNLRRMVEDDSNVLRIDDQEYSEFLLDILNGKPKDELAIRAARWRLDSTETRLSRLSEQAKRLAKRLGKEGIAVNVESNELLLESDSWTQFWSALIHVIRNAVDHGIEEIEDRDFTRKSGTGTLTVSTYRKDQEFVVSIRDDGRGIDWERIREVAEQKQLPAASRADLVKAMFSDGVSTAASVTDTSGRGVGMGALKDACESLGGAIDVESDRGNGTEFKFIFPAEMMAPKTNKLFATFGVANAIDAVTSGAPH